MGPRKAQKKSREAKEANWARLQDLTTKFNKALFVDVDNVSSLQLTKIRAALRKIDAEMIMGKNTLMKASLNRFITKPEEGDFDFEARKDSFKERPDVEKIISLLKGNTGIIYTNKSLADIKEILDNETRGAPAKAGSIAPDDVWIMMGPTGLDPKQTSFFQTLNIQTKINKSQVEIIQDKKIIEAGQKVEPTHAALLDKLKITPFSYKMEVKHVYDNGTLINPSVLDIKAEDIVRNFSKAITNMASVSLGCGYVTKPAVPHLIGNSFKNLVAVTFESEFTFKQAEAMKKAASAGPAPAGGAAPAKAAAKVEEEDEEADVGTGGMFDDEY
jgi:large subunit ribosomal protein LP0